MTPIKAEISKDKKSKEITYSFQANSEAFKAYYSPKELTLEIMHNETSLGAIYGKIDRKRKLEFTANTNAEPLKITAWIDDGFSFFGNIFRKLKGIGIEVNGVPVQHTLADHETYLSNGRTWLYLLLFILGSKSALVYHSVFKEYASHITAAITSSIYIVPLIIVLIAAIKYKAWTTFALLSSIAISSLEMIDYIASIETASNGVAIWIILRISTLYALCNAFRWNRKKNVLISPPLTKEITQ